MADERAGLMAAETPACGGRYCINGCWSEPRCVLPRPIEGCRFIDAEDGTCGHPDAYSPECWKDGDDMSDCPLVPTDG